MEAWRKSVIYEKGTPLLFADLGMGVMDDAMVEAAAYVRTFYLRNTFQPKKINEIGSI